MFAQTIFWMILGAIIMVEIEKSKMAVLDKKLSTFLPCMIMLYSTYNDRDVNEWKVNWYKKPYF